MEPKTRPQTNPNTRQMSTKTKVAAGALAAATALGLGVARHNQMNEADTPAIPTVQTAHEHPGDFTHRKIGRTETVYGVAAEYTDNDHTLTANVDSLSDQVKAQGMDPGNAAGADVEVPPTTVPAEQRGHARPDG